MTFRKEQKFRVTLSDYHKFQDLLYGQGLKTLFKPRFIHSVYFDTVDLKMFHDSEEGVRPRKKVRIRWYDNDKTFFQENKISSIEGRFKKSKALECTSSEEQIANKVLLDSFYGTIHPTLKISYKRWYFSLENLRVTFDESIRYQKIGQSNRRIYNDPERVVEIKTPANCSEDFVEKYIPYPPIRFSKYCRGLLLFHGDMNEF